ncbi:hypothetical protein PRK78_002173 [Emydomyces testavorans]|uniref:Thioesterase domain-containing protein n=1 Tax=Emydomyces testavorans TaxID=2070801 RepID=A0AAF0DDT9_9EURO|nr:hypothetical protein PRK78_002173 [Emydomyces testavorans]
MPRLRGVLSPSSLFRLSHRQLCPPPPLRPWIPHRRTLRSPTIRTFSTASPPPSARRQPAQWPRHFRSILYAIIFGSLGYHCVNEGTRDFFTPVLQPGTAEDIEAQKQIGEEFDRLKIVKKLRADPDFVEWEAYGNFSPEEKAKRVTSGGLSGSRGISSQHIFWNEKTKTAISVLYLGNGIAGWPGIVHGGALAMLLDESMGRVALRNVAARTGVTANLNMEYRKPVIPGQFCTVTARYEPEKSNERKAMVSGELRDSTGRLCIEANALFVVPRSLTLRKLDDGF